MKKKHKALVREFLREALNLPPGAGTDVIAEALGLNENPSALHAQRWGRVRRGLSASHLTPDIIGFVPVPGQPGKVRSVAFDVDPVGPSVADLINSGHLARPRTGPMFYSIEAVIDRTPLEVLRRRPSSAGVDLGGRHAGKQGERVVMRPDPQSELELFANLVETFRKPAGPGPFTVHGLIKRQGEDTGHEPATPEPREGATIGKVFVIDDCPVLIGQLARRGTYLAEGTKMCLVVVGGETRIEARMGHTWRDLGPLYPKSGPDMSFFDGCQLGVPLKEVANGQQEETPLAKGQRLYPGVQKLPAKLADGTAILVMGVFPHGRPVPLSRFLRADTGETGKLDANGVFTPFREVEDDAALYKKVVDRIPTKGDAVEVDLDADRVADLVAERRVVVGARGETFELITMNEKGDHFAVLKVSKSLLDTLGVSLSWTENGTDVERFRYRPGGPGLERMTGSGAWAHEDRMDEFTFFNLADLAAPLGSGLHHLEVEHLTAAPSQAVKEAVRQAREALASNNRYEANLDNLPDLVETTLTTLSRVLGVGIAVDVPSSKPEHGNVRLKLRRGESGSVVLAWRWGLPGGYWETCRKVTPAMFAKLATVLDARDPGDRWLQVR